VSSEHELSAQVSASETVSEDSEAGQEIPLQTKLRKQKKFEIDSDELMTSQEESETLLNFGQNQGQEPLRRSQFQSPFVAKNPKGNVISGHIGRTVSPRITFEMGTHL